MNSPKDTIKVCLHQVLEVVLVIVLRMNSDTRFVANILANTTLDVKCECALIWLS